MQRWITRAILWAPAAAAAVFVLVLLANQGEIRAGLGSHADYASTPVLAELITKAPPGSSLALGDYAWYEAFWLLRATSWLPNHLFVWQLVPFVLWLGTAFLAGFSARRASGSRWAGLTVVALVICGGVAMRGALWSLNTHGPAAFHAALLAAAVVLAVSSPRWARGIRGWGSATVLALVTAVGATDPLVIAVGVGPLLAAGLVLAFWRRDSKLLQLGAYISAVSIVGAKVLDGLAVDALITWTHKPLNFVAIDGIVGHLNLLPGIVARMASVSPFGGEIELETAIAMIAAIAGLIAAIVVMQVSVRQFKRAVWPERFGIESSVPADAVRDAADDAADAPEAVDTEAVFVVGLVFWFSVVAINLVAFVFTTAAFDVYGARYLVPGWVAICVLIPVLGVRTNLRWLAGLTATVLCVASTYSLINEPDPTFEAASFPTVPLANEIQRFAEANGAQYGYASFWDAIPITWHTRFGIEAYPVLQCGKANCRFYQHNISSWYEPKPGRSFLVVDPTLPLQPTVDPKYGDPVATTKIGPVTVNIYDYDIASKLG